MSGNQAFNHELVNSLTSVKSLAELLVEYPSLDAGERCRFISIIRDESERLVRLIDHLKLACDTAVSL